MEKIIDFIKKLQQKPKGERTRVLWLFTFISIVLIFSIWFVLLKHSLKQAREENLDDNFVAQDLKDSFQKAKDEWPLLKNNLQGSMGGLFENEGKETESPFNQ